MKKIPIRRKIAILKRTTKETNKKSCREANDKTHKPKIV